MHTKSTLSGSCADNDDAEGMDDLFSMLGSDSKDAPGASTVDASFDFSSYIKNNS